MNDTHLKDLKTYVIEGWQSTTAEVKQNAWYYLAFRDDLSMINGVAMKGR